MPYLPKKQPKRSYIKQQQRKPTSNQRFYADARWTKTRELYRKSVGLLCEACLYSGINHTEPRMPVDHIIPIEHGGDELDKRNLNLLCHSHHNSKSGREAHSAGPLVEWQLNERGKKIPVSKGELWKLLTN